MQCCHARLIGRGGHHRRGFGVQEMTDLANWMCDILEDHKNDALVASVKARVLALCKRYPVYG